MQLNLWKKSTEKVLAAQQYPHLALFFTPDAIREHFQDEYSEVIDDLTDEELAAIGEDALYDNDNLYSAFHEGLMWSLAQRGLVSESDI